ncbi:MAG TPA: DUF2278 family protein [Ideonella sp.]|nr:DUF2278 family protein [Ideonella sp.]
MPLNAYGVLRGRPIARQLGAGSSPHYQIHLVDQTVDYRAAINVASALSPSELEYLIDSHFSHPVLDELAELPLGWRALPSGPGGMALDFIRTNLFDPSKMTPLPFNVPGPDNDLNEKLDHYVQRAMADEAATAFVFGQRWGPEKNAKDRYFGFLPGNGVHDIHMNQGNVGSYVRDDGVYQDGALLLHLPAQAQWVGIFLKFQSQTWHTDDRTGHQIPPPPPPPPGNGGDPGTPRPTDGVVRIVAALVNSEEDPERETITLLNVTARTIDLTGWRLLDRNKVATALSGSLDAGEARRIAVVTPMALSNKGGVITLLDASGLRVDGVTYTKADAALQGHSVKF